ncbi:hypothetical protein [Rhodococcoides fascians]|uniref:hypothetical protein n=1 Tax=Rhodococcoides fascians TaxID=1828 RepID=UPI0007AC00F0|nr:hypothetical protein [Rhodococcus fascians]
MASKHSTPSMPLWPTRPPAVQAAVADATPVVQTAVADAAPAFAAIDNALAAAGLSNPLAPAVPA